MFNKLLLFTLTLVFKNACNDIVTVPTTLSNDRPKEFMPSTNDLEWLLDGKSIYVDKTPYVLRLLRHGCKNFFLTRPKRFGKTVFLRVLELILQGEKNKSLFKGTHIYKDSNYDWKTYPTLYLNFFSISSYKKGWFEKHLSYKLMNLSESVPANQSIECQVRVLIETLYRKGPVAVLIDEYDFPVTHGWIYGDNVLADENREVTRRFFAALLSLESYLKLILVTGVNKLSQESIFSGANRFYDISMDPLFAGIVGYTEDEVFKYFKDHIRFVSKNEGMSEEDLKRSISRQYSGYKFSHETNETVYNPWSVVKCLTNRGHIGNYWIKSMNPDFIFDHIRRCGMKPKKCVTKGELQGIDDLSKISPSALMYHYGYVTIDNYDKEKDEYSLKYPNMEIRKSFKNKG